MTATEMKNRIYSVIDSMSPDKLNAVLALLEELQRSSEDETSLLLNDPGFMRDYREAKEDIRTNSTVSLKAIRRDV